MASASTAGGLHFVWATRAAMAVLLPSPRLHDMRAEDMQTGTTRFLPSTVDVGTQPTSLFFTSFRNTSFVLASFFPATLLRCSEAEDLTVFIRPTKLAFALGRSRGDPTATILSVLISMISSQTKVERRAKRGSKKIEMRHGEMRNAGYAEGQLLTHTMCTEREAKDGSRNLGRRGRGMHYRLTEC